MYAYLLFENSAYSLIVSLTVSREQPVAPLGRPEAEDSKEQTSAWRVAILPLMFPPRIRLSDRILPLFPCAVWRM